MNERLATLARAFRRGPMQVSSALAVTLATALILVAALVGAMIRLLPWALDPSVAWSTLAPFARSLLAVAFEAALMIGWPVGWTLAAQRLVDRGEARVLASLGESPARTVARLLPQAAVLAAVLVISSGALGRETRAPGRVVNALLAQGRATCVPGQTHGVPFVSVTWLCPPSRGGDARARLVGRAPVGNVVFTADDAVVSDDLRRIELEDARLAMPTGTDAVNVRVHVESLVLRGLAPWARASSLPPLLRALLVTSSALLAGSAGAAALLLWQKRRVGRVGAAAIGAAGPLAALVTLRALELRVPEVDPGAWLLLFGLVPIAAFVVALGAAALVTALPEGRRAGSK